MVSIFLRKYIKLMNSAVVVRKKCSFVAVSGLRVKVFPLLRGAIFVGEAQFSGSFKLKFGNYM